MNFAILRVSKLCTDNWSHCSPLLWLPTFLGQPPRGASPRLVKTKQYTKIRQAQPDLLPLQFFPAFPQITLSSFLLPLLDPPQCFLASLPARLPATEIAPTNNSSAFSPQLQPIATRCDNILQSRTQHSSDDSITQRTTINLPQGQRRRGAIAFSKLPTQNPLSSIPA